MKFTISRLATINTETTRLQGLGDIFLIEDVVKFSYGLNTLVGRIQYDADYLKQLPKDHFLAVEMDKSYGNSDWDWRRNAPALFGSTAVLEHYNYLFDKNTHLGDVSTQKFLAELSDLVSSIATSTYSKDAPWWSTDLFRPIKEVKDAISLINNWNKVKDHSIILGRNLKIEGNSVYHIGVSDGRLKLTMEHMPKFELKYLLGRPKIKLDVAETEQALWISENPNIASVYKGKITGISKGKTKIIVRYYNKKATIPIEVK